MARAARTSNIRSMKAIHDIAAYALLAVLVLASVVVGILSGVALLAAALIPPIIGVARLVGAELAATGNRVIHPHTP
jgi:Na+/H+-translocating membrane pyrophosphatase